MQDRVSGYPGRVTLVPVSGETNTYTMTRADEPTQVGTPLNTATLLSSNAASAVNTATGSTPDTPSEAIQSLAGAVANKQNTLTFPISVANGGTGLTSSPSVLTNLSSTSAVNVMQASPRPGVTGTLPVANGGTGQTSAPSMLTNLSSTSAANVFQASPRPGVTGTLPLGNGGTGATTAANALGGLISGSATFSYPSVATNDYFAFYDTSASTGRKLTASDLLSYIANNGNFLRAGTKSVYYFDQTFTDSFIKTLDFGGAFGMYNDGSETSIGSGQWTYISPGYVSFLYEIRENVYNLSTMSKPTTWTNVSKCYSLAALPGENTEGMHTYYLSAYWDGTRTVFLYICTDSSVLNYNSRVYTNFIARKYGY